MGGAQFFAPLTGPRHVAFDPGWPYGGLAKGGRGSPYPFVWLGSVSGPTVDNLRARGGAQFCSPPCSEVTAASKVERDYAVRL